MPAELEHDKFYWLHSERSLAPGIAQWWGGGWFTIGSADHITAAEMTRRGWEVLGPVAPRPHSAYLDK